MPLLLPLLRQASRSHLSPPLLATASQPTLPQPRRALTHPLRPPLLPRHLRIAVSPTPELYLLDPHSHPTSLLQPSAPVAPQSMWGPPCQASSRDRWEWFDDIKSSTGFVDRVSPWSAFLTKLTSWCSPQAFNPAALNQMISGLVGQLLLPGQMGPSMLLFVPPH